MWATRNTYRIFVKKPLGRPRKRENNIKWTLGIESEISGSHGSKY
jgi:hypothetical protein